MKNKNVHERHEKHEKNRNCLCFSWTKIGGGYEIN
jgi:hypothetical protein